MDTQWCISDLSCRAPVRFYKPTYQELGEMAGSWGRESQASTA